MKTSPRGRKIIELFEGLRTERYLDSGGVPTIGYGHTENVANIATCTQEQADAWLVEDLATAEAAVMAATADLGFGPVVLNQNQFDACVSLAFNIGGRNFEQSTVAKLMRAGDWVGAANAFLLWDKIKGVFNLGLSNRRRAERTLFMDDPNTDAS